METNNVSDTLLPDLEDAMEDLDQDKDKTEDRRPPASTTTGHKPAEQGDQVFHFILRLTDFLKLFSSTITR